MRKSFFIRNLTAAGFLFFFSAELSALPRTIQLFDSTRLAGNSIVEIVYNSTTKTVWLATERGISRTSDNGATWQNFDKDNTGDLLSNEVAALGLRNDTLWAATSFTRVFGDQTQGFQSVPFGTGFTIMDDDGDTLRHFTPDQDSGAGMLAFDLSFSDSAVWAASFFGGLVRSTDGGITWINAFADSLAKFDFETQSFINRNNRFFSVAADTFRSNDTIVVWAGSAAGLNKFIYLPRRLELADNRIFAIAFDGSRHWLGTADGLSYTPDSGRSFISISSSAGVPATGAVSALYAIADTILAAFTDDDSLRNGAGLFRSTDGGANWSPIATAYASGTARVVRQIVQTDSGFYAAADAGGLLFRHRDSVSWKNLFPDSELTQKNRQFLSLAPFSPTPDSLILLGGTRFGLATMIFTTNPVSFDSIRYTLADTNTFSGNRIEKVAVDRFKNSILTYWVVAHPDAFPESYSVNRSTDTGKTWSNRFAAIPAYEIAFQDSALWLGVFDSLLFSGDNGFTFKSVLVRDTVTRLSLVRRTVRALLTDSNSNSVWAGTTNGAAFTTSDSGQNWGVFRTEKEEAYRVQRYFFSLTNPTVPGNFVVVLGVQKASTDTVIWVGSHTTDIAGERSGIAWSQDDGATWSQAFLDTLAWNFAFWRDTVWVATSSGLFRSPDMGQNWQPVLIAGVDAYSGAATSFSELVEILSVRQTGPDTVWVGSTDGAAVSFDNGQNWKIFRRFLSTGTGPGTAGAEIYASPVPFSPNRGLGVCRFHYRPVQNSNVTIEIFDFAMRRVKTVVENALRSAGVQYDTDSWDGKNEKGDWSANGTYFFRIDFGGEKKWGKLVVLK